MEIIIPDGAEIKIKWKRYEDVRHPDITTGDSEISIRS